MRELNKILLSLTSEGYAPTVLYDDNGHWSVSFNGMMSTAHPGHQEFIEPDLQWFDTPLDAAINAIP